MKGVRINGEESGIQTDGLPRLIDVIELIKNTIDPDHMITQVLLDGRELTEGDWAANTSSYQTSIIEIQTGTPQEFVEARLACAGQIVQACYLEFREARKFFKDGTMAEGNKQLIQATNTLQAFFEWYGTMLELVPEQDRSKYDINEDLTNISEVCKKICQQQLYQSWWALGETLESELEPALDKLEDFCRKFAH